MTEIPLFIYPLFFCIAFLYGSAGHGGASGYLAILTLTGLFSPILVPVVLILNILVSGIAFFNYSTHGHFRWNLFLPFALSSIPFAFLGGLISVEATIFFIMVGAVLFLMGILVFLKSTLRVNPTILPVKYPVAVLAGAVIGFISGLIGVGGGIFLSPLILFLGWGSIAQIAAVSALFVNVNSISGLIGHTVGSEILWLTAFWLSLPVLAGGFLGSRFGVKTVNPDIIRYILGVILIIAAIKMIAQYAF